MADHLKKFKHAFLVLMKAPGHKSKTYGSEGGQIIK